MSLDGETFTSSPKRGHLDPFEWMNTVMSNDKDGCKKLKDGEVNETHEAMEFTKEYTKNCKMSLSNINECACDTSAEFQQVRRIYVIEFFLLYVYSILR